jgi:hypothetical protein
MNEHERRRINVDELLEEESLTLTIGGEDYVVKDIPLSVSMKYQSGGAINDLEFLRDVLIPLGAKEEDLTQEKLGSRQVQIITMALLDFFVSSAGLMEKMKLSPLISQLYQTGLERLATSSALTQATE